jgi:hypothetical protein
VQVSNTKGNEMLCAIATAGLQKKKKEEEIIS